MGSIVWIIVIGTSIWVYFDAKSIGARKGLLAGLFNLGPVGWGLSCLGIWIIGFPAYLVKRKEIRTAVAKDTYKNGAVQQTEEVPQPNTITAILPQPHVENSAKACPFCAEIIKKEAIYCRFCNKDLSPKQQHPLSPEIPPAKQDWELRGKQHLSNGTYDEAVMAFSKAIDERETGGLFYARAVAYSKMKDATRMKSDLKSAAKLGHEKARVTLEKIAA